MLTFITRNHEEELQELVLHYTGHFEKLDKGGWSWTERVFLVSSAQLWTVAWDVSKGSYIYNEKSSALSARSITINEINLIEWEKNAKIKIKKDIKHWSSEYKWWLPARKIRVDVSLSS